MKTHIGETPNSVGAVSRSMVQGMKPVCTKRSVTFGEFVAHAYDAWGKRKAAGLVWLAIQAHLIEFRGRQRFVIS